MPSGGANTRVAQWFVSECSLLMREVGGSSPPPRTKFMTTEDGPKGIGGWLLGFILSLVPYVFYYALGFFFSFLNNWWVDMPLFALAILSLLLLCILSIVFLLAKHADALLLTKIFIVANAAFWETLALTAGRLSIGLLIVLAHSVGSGIYLIKSQRVCNTYRT